MTNKKKQQATKDHSSNELPRMAIPNMYSHRTIHERLKHLRQMNDLTLEALSLVTKGVDPDSKGISRVSLSRYESGTEPGLRELKILSWAFRRSLSFLVYGDTEDPMGRVPVNLDLIIEDIVAETLEHILANKGLIPPVHPSKEELDYEKLLEAAKRLSK